MAPPRSAARRRRPRGWRRLLPRFRTVAAAAAVLAVVSAGAALGLYVSVTSRFDGTLWQIPSRVWSDVLDLVPNEAFPADELEARLLRGGYVRTDGAPERPGQFRRSGAVFDLYLREFSAPSDASPAVRRRVVFRQARVDRIEDGRGRRVRRATLEPELLATLYGPRQEDRIPIELADVPDDLVAAVLAAEDARFFEHHGIDVRGILRAGWVNLTHGRVVQGGSTITQQTVKNLYLGQERTLWRKLRELPMAAILDARYPKERILETYLNEVYLGQRGPVAICGIEAAARFYFGLGVRDLSLSEWALLAGMIRSPGSYNPFVDPERAVARRDDVLDAMVRRGFVEAERAEAAKKRPLRVARGTQRFSGGAYAVDFALSEIAELFPRSVLESRGLSVYTTIDTRLQLAAEEALRAGIERLERDVPVVRRQIPERALQGAVVVTRPASGSILAMVGGRDYATSQFNRAAQARRQPGSCFKPFVYAAGFESAEEGRAGGLTPATVLEDTPLELTSGGQAWRPANYDHEFRGAVTVRRALEESLNVPTVRAAREVGLDRVIEVARAAGIESPLPELPSLALGAAEVTPVELASAYGTFAAEGVRVRPWIVRAVVDADGKRVDAPEVERRAALRPETAFLISDILYGVFERGTARSASAWGFPGGAAGKTGTTDDTRDAWFVGYTDDVLALVWVGYDDNARTGLTGATGALPVWVDLMHRSGADADPLSLEVPDDVVARRIDPESGELAVPGCPQAFLEYFVRGTEPRTTCPLHQSRIRRWWRDLIR